MRNKILKIIDSAGIVDATMTKEDLIDQLLALFKKHEEEVKKEAIQEIIRAYDRKAKEYKEDGGIITAKLMIDIRDIALEVLNQLTSKGKI